MDSIEIVKAYFSALDSADIENASQYQAENYQLVGMSQEPMDRIAMLRMLSLFKVALPDLKHSLSNISVDGNVVKLTVQLSGTNTGPLDLTRIGIGVIPRSGKFIIFPNGTYEITVQDDKIVLERDVSPVSPNRRMPGRLKALGVTLPVTAPHRPNP